MDEDVRAEVSALRERISDLERALLSGGADRVLSLGEVATVIGRSVSARPFLAGRRQGAKPLPGPGFPPERRDWTLGLDGERSECLATLAAVAVWSAEGEGSVIRMTSPWPRTPHQRESRGWYPRPSVKGGHIVSTTTHKLRSESRPVKLPYLPWLECVDPKFAVACVENGCGWIYDHATAPARSAAPRQPCTSGSPSTAGPA